MTYTIAELKPGEKGGFAPRGACRKLWGGRNFETMVSGPAETGKTWACLQYADALLWKYPGANGVVAGSEWSTLIGTCLNSYKRIIGPDSPIKPYGGERPQWFDYPNGSRLWWVGLDNEGKSLSSERDFIYVNQAERIELRKWETLSTRCTGRGAVMPYTRLFGDCNPDTPYHWIKQREASGVLQLLESRHEDNPTLYDDEGNITEQGRKTLAILDALTGPRKQRLRYGRWVQAEGAVYENFDAAIHVIDPFPIPDGWRRIRMIDFGYTNPFVCLWGATDSDGRLYVYRQVYHSKRLVEDHAKQINTLSTGERFEASISDHDAEDRATLDRHGIATVSANKAVTVGIQAVANRLNVQPDGKPRLFIMRGSLVEVDPELQALHKPLSLDQEFGAYVWPKGKDDKPVKEEPVKLHDHALDALRYGVMYLDSPTGAWVADPDVRPSAAKPANPFAAMLASDHGWNDLGGRI